jgi:hypothetical protein
MKKKGLLVLFLALFVLSSFIVSAQYYSSYSSYGSGFFGGMGYYASYGPVWLEQNVGQYFAWFLGGTGDYLFERILLFFILIAFLFVIIKRIPFFKNNLGANIVVTIAISLLISRFFGDTEYLKTVLAPYTVLGIALSAVIPLVIYFFFVESFESSTLRKILWIFFIVVFFGIWSTRAPDLGQAAYIYLLTGIVALVLLFADGTIRRIMWKERMGQMSAKTTEDAARQINDQLYKLHEDFDKKHIIDEEYYNKERRRLQKSLKSLRKW